MHSRSCTLRSRYHGKRVRRGSHKTTENDRPRNTQPLVTLTTKSRPGLERHGLHELVQPGMVPPPAFDVVPHESVVGQQLTWPDARYLIQNPWGRLLWSRLCRGKHQDQHLTLQQCIPLREIALRLRSSARHRNSRTSTVGASSLYRLPRHETSDGQRFGLAVQHMWSCNRCVNHNLCQRAGRCRAASLQLRR